MKLNLKRLVKTIDGKDFMHATPDGRGLEEKPITLQQAMFNALVSQLRGDEVLDLQKKLEVHKLANKVSHAEDSASFTNEEIVMIKDRASKLYGVHLLGQFVQLIEEEPAPPADPPLPQAGVS